MPGPDSGPYHGAQYSRSAPLPADLSELPDELPLTHQQSLPTSDKLKINDLNGPMPEMWADAHGGSPTLGRSSSLHRRMSGDRNALPQNSHELMRLNSADFEFIYPGLQVGASVREINTGMSGVIEDIIHSRKGSSAKVQMDGTGHLMQFFLRDLELNMDDGFVGEPIKESAIDDKKLGLDVSWEVEAPLDDTRPVDPWREKRPPGGQSRKKMREEDGVGQWQSASGRDDDHVARMEWMNQQNVGPRIGQNELSRTTSGMRGRSASSAQAPLRERDQQENRADHHNMRWTEINQNKSASAPPVLLPPHDLPSPIQPRYQRSSPLPLDRKTGAAQVTGIPDNADIKHLLGAVSNAIGANRVNNKVWIANGTAILQFESVTYLNMLLGDERKREGTMEIKVGGQASNCKILRVDLKTQKVKFQARSMGLGWCQTPQKKAGCVVVDVTPDSQADRLGVKRGWIATYVEETALDSRGPIGIIEKHKKKDRDFHVTFQHIQQREVRTRGRSNSLGPSRRSKSDIPKELSRSVPTSKIRTLKEYSELSASAPPMTSSDMPRHSSDPIPGMFNRPKDALDRTVSGKLQDDSVMYSPRASRQTSESGLGFHGSAYHGQQVGGFYRNDYGASPVGEYYDDMSWANKVRGGSQDSHQRMMAGVAAGLNRDTGYGSRVQNGSGRDQRYMVVERTPYSSAFGYDYSGRAMGSDMMTSGDGSGGSSKRKRRSGRRGKKNLEYGYDRRGSVYSDRSYGDRYNRPRQRTNRIYTCPQCATKCNGPQQLQQHIGSAGCKLRQLNLSRVECQPERSVFIGNIPLNCEEGDVLKSLTDRGVKVDTMQRADGDIPVIEMRMGKKCKYAVVQLVSAEERLNVVTIHHDEKITEKVMITGDVIQYEDDGKTPLYQEDGKTMVTKKGTVQLDIKPCRPRGEKSRGH